jgi:putative phosphoesterase
MNQGVHLQNSPANRQTDSVRIAVVSDVHGNLPALEAALADIDTFCPDIITHAGDMVNGPFSREVLDLLQDRRIYGVVGNHERYVIDVGLPTVPAELVTSRLDPARWTRSTLSDNHLHEIEQWPIEHMPHPDVTIFHGSPGDIRAALHASMSEGDVQAMYEDVDAPVVVCGHLHRYHVRSIDGKLYTNVGSTGQPIFGEPKATYLLLAKEAGIWSAERRLVCYDTERLLHHARSSGWLATGGFAATAVHEMISGERWSGPFMKWLDIEMPDADLVDAYRIFARNRGVEPLI